MPRTRRPRDRRCSTARWAPPSVSDSTDPMQRVVDGVVDGDHGDGAVSDLAELILAAAHGKDDEAVAASIDERTNDVLLAVVLTLRAGEVDEIAVAIAGLLDAPGQLGEERVDEVGGDEADRVAPAGRPGRARAGWDGSRGARSIARTRARVAAAGPGRSLTTRDTVRIDTPACVGDVVEGRGPAGRCRQGLVSSSTIGRIDTSDGSCHRWQGLANVGNVPWGRCCASVYAGRRTGVAVVRWRLQPGAVARAVRQPISTPSSDSASTPSRWASSPGR